jgi:hypothetical protein
MHSIDFAFGIFYSRISRSVWVTMKDELEEALGSSTVLYILAFHDIIYSNHFILESTDTSSVSNRKNLN